MRTFHAHNNYKKKLILNKNKMLSKPADITFDYTILELKFSKCSPTRILDKTI